MFTSVLILFIFFGLYAMVHSLLASLPVKAWVRRKGGAATDSWYRLAYNTFAVITLLPLFPLLIILPDKILYLVPAPWCWVMLGGQGLALLGLGVALWQTGALHFLGLLQLFTKQPAQSNLFSVFGFYKWVRHPLYSFSLLFLWLTPLMSVNLLTLFILCTLYFYFGSIHEEQRLVAEFGTAYKDYQQRVPRLIPWPGRSYGPD
ncbi:MAG: isoprenylcysteine carboxylmethyltransferase family protein [Anaerolineae bacterium]|nr:isoprenylcysteine carboxylmethyltransferase family protein [Anaerolineae bacterium]